MVESRIFNFRNPRVLLRVTVAVPRATLALCGYSGSDLTAFGWPRQTFLAYKPDRAVSRSCSTVICEKLTPNPCENQILQRIQPEIKSLYTSSVQHDDQVHIH